MKIKNMINANGNTVPNQFIITNGLIKTFQSYESTIAEYNTDTQEITIYPDWDYSKTTMKFFKQFINEETMFGYESKAQFLKAYGNNHMRVFFK